MCASLGCWGALWPLLLVKWAVVLTLVQLLHKLLQCSVLRLQLLLGAVGGGPYMSACYQCWPFMGNSMWDCKTTEAKLEGAADLGLGHSGTGWQC